MRDVLAPNTTAAVPGRSFPQRRRIRVLVADDAVIMRRVISQVLESDADIEVIGTAPDGAEAIKQVERFKPDLMTLDMEMPRMNGLEVLKHLRQIRSTVRVIMVSSLTARGASATFEALALGAHDYVTKPVSGSIEESLDGLRRQLLPKIRQFFPPEAEPAPIRRPSSETTASEAVGRRTRTTKPQIVVLGVSTGGPNALAAIMPQFPADFPLPILIVQHMPPLFTRQLADGLANKCRIKVKEASDRQPVQKGLALIAPGEYHLKLVREAGQLLVRLNQDAPENFCRPAVDVLFRSAAQELGDRVLSIVLTGMGQDGLRGAKLIKAAGGVCLVQDEKSSVVWGMPGAIAKAGMADEILTLESIVPKVLTYV